MCPNNADTRISTLGNPTSLQQMVGNTGFQLARVLFPLGEHTYDGTCGSAWSATSQDGMVTFGFADLDAMIDRRLTVNPFTKIVLQVALDGSKKWVQNHPGNQDDPSLNAAGIPDYQSSDWRATADQAIAVLINHVQTRYSGTVVAYQLFNGPAMDGNFPINLSSADALRRFRDFLKVKYGGDPSLKTAWGDTNVSIATAVPKLNPDHAIKRTYAPLFSPALDRQFADTRDFEMLSREQVYFDFADSVKKHSKGQALVGVRGGEFLLGPWQNATLSGVPWQDVRYPVYAGLWENTQTFFYHSPKFYEYPNIDFYEIWEPYEQPRQFGFLSGSGAPLVPVQALTALNKVYVVENDYRVFSGSEAFWDASVGNGFEADYDLSLQKVRRVFVSALLSGMSQVLWEMSYDFGNSHYLDEWKIEQEIATKALKLDMSSVAEVAYVVDSEFPKNFVHFYDGGSHGQPDVNTPGPGFYTIQDPMASWARAGAPYDMIFLNQLASLRPYKVYVFYHTLAMSAAQMQSIRDVLEKNSAIGIFVYADGMMDEQGVVSAVGIGAGVSALTGMQIVGEMTSRGTSQLAPTAQMGTVNMDRWRNYTTRGGGAVDFSYFPSFSVQLEAGTDFKALAHYVNDATRIAVAEKVLPSGRTVIYSALPYLPPDLIRYALNKASATQYSDSENHLFLNRSFLGFHTTVSCISGTGCFSPTMTLNLPGTSALFNVYERCDLSSSAAEFHPVNGKFTIPVSVNSTYLYYRGSKDQWCGLI